ncbi:pseudouridine synthase [Metamycoplasma neophronis]|uniref:Pseudouridine synthase n=1 Tax=Metamycoplasma neophronis TaxID=872983 RepID=A0ABY2Z0A4_9BACT|nr:pseudouridine synthase [Metamycoplasma neophronis]TPR54305.1 rRNA pseudouridine synthase [Metamycoplasma neophronis]
MARIRIEKFIADTTSLTRKEVKKIMDEGFITVNGETIRRSISIDTNDEVRMYDEVLTYEKYQYYMMNKPSGYITANHDRFDPTIFDLVPELRSKKLFAYGRLDKDTEGLLIISNDGELGHRLLNPKYHVPKTYYVEVDKSFDEEIKNHFPKPIKIGADEIIYDYNFEFISDTECLLTIKEGKFHQVKRMLEFFKYEIIYLKRLTFGPLTLDENLEPGETRKLSDEEIKLLKKNI